MSGGNRYAATIGLEIHVELKTRTKLFCGCPNRFGAPPNRLVCPVCLGLPGTLPVLNRRAVELGILAALALDCQVAPESVFARKNYFYPDLPKGYQISQYEQPLASGGQLGFAVGGARRSLRLRRVHLEEDAGKSLHGDDAARASGIPGHHSLLDFNRCGVPLIEIVTEPELNSPDEARAFLETLKQLLEHAGVSDVKLQEGSLRCDANISVRPVACDRPGMPVEIKNLNSFRFVHRAIAYEIERQSALLDAGKQVLRETRQYLEATGTTETLRRKEQADDYRYFPDPDLLRLRIEPEWLGRLRDQLPELPAARRERYRREFGLADEDAELLVTSLPLACFFERTVALGAQPRIAANWTLAELVRLMNAHDRPADAIPLPPEHLVELLRLLESGRLSRPLARTVLEDSFLTGRSPQAVVAASGVSQLTDEAQVAAMVDQAIAAHPGSAADYRAGKGRALDFLVGQVMRASQGRANPALVNRILRERLGDFTAPARTDT
jgi:aspartyl-tRNA(Asn)/glutamyl-tRNA(Gln) amidotransferase subunit B